GAESTVGIPVVGVGRQAEPHTVAEPVMALTADGNVIELFETWCVLVTHDEIRLVAAQSGAANQQSVVSSRRQRLGKQDSSLQVVDVVVHGVPQVDYSGDDT